MLLQATYMTNVNSSQNGELREGPATTGCKKMAKDSAEEIEVHFNSMPDRYFQSHNLNEIIGHIRLFRSFVERLRHPTLALSAS